MNFIEHNIEKYLKEDIQKKIAFLTNPRQVGKTTLAKKIVSERKGLYLLYDESEHKKNLYKII